MVTQEEKASIASANYKLGVQFGRDEGKAEIARAMSAKGYPVSEIAELTGLSQADIQAL